MAISIIVGILYDASVLLILVVLLFDFQLSSTLPQGSGNVQPQDPGRYLVKSEVCKCYQFYYLLFHKCFELPGC